jgi:hypothetical protein
LIIKFSLGACFLSATIENTEIKCICISTGMLELKMKQNGSLTEKEKKNKRNYIKFKAICLL